MAELAREEVPDEVINAYAGRRAHYGPEYIIPSPFDPRLIECIPPKVAAAAMASGVARRDIEDMDAYRQTLRARLNPTVSTLSQMFERLRKTPRRVVFAEAEEDRVLRAALSFQAGGYGTAILIGQEEIVRAKLEAAGAQNIEGIEVYSARSENLAREFTEFLYERLNRRGHLYRDVQRLVKRDRNVFAACMVAKGHADAMVTGVTRHYWQALQDVMLVIDAKEGRRPFGLAAVVTGKSTVFIADATVTEEPTAEELADIAVQAAEAVRRLGQTPRVAFVSFSNFGNPMRERAQRVRDAVAMLDTRRLDFEYDGEMSADVALDADLLELYPFCRLSGPANVLIMPALHSANISAKLLQKLGGGTVIGPLLIGLSKPAQIVQMGATVSEVVNLAALAAHDAID